MKKNSSNILLLVFILLFVPIGGLLLLGGAGIILGLIGAVCLGVVLLSDKFDNLATKNKYKAEAKKVEQLKVDNLNRKESIEEKNQLHKRELYDLLKAVQTHHEIADYSFENINNLTKLTVIANHINKPGANAISLDDNFFLYPIFYSDDMPSDLGKKITNLIPYIASRLMYYNRESIDSGSIRIHFESFSINSSVINEKQKLAWFYTYKIMKLFHPLRDLNTSFKLFDCFVPNYSFRDLHEFEDKYSLNSIPNTLNESVKDYSETTLKLYEDILSDASEMPSFDSWSEEYRLDLQYTEHIPYESSVKRLKDILQEETLSGFTQRDKVLSHVGALLEDFTFDKNN